VLTESKRGEVWAKIINNEIQIHYRLDGKQKRRKSIWTGTKMDASTHGSELLNSLFKLSQFSFPKSIYAVKDSLSSMTKSKDALFLDYFAGSGTTGHAAISLNRDDQGNRKYILVEQGEYFDTVTKPRIQKAIYSSDWKDGIAISSLTGVSQAFKVIKVESYEDTLNNLSLQISDKQSDLINRLTDSAKEDYLLKYMLDIESRGSFLSLNHFSSPFNFKMKIAVNSSGAYQDSNVDLVETFNYLIGLRVKTYDMQREKGFALITGWLPTGEKTLVIWRDEDLIGYEELGRLCEKLALNPSDSEFDIVYINGDNNIPSVFTATEVDGGITKRLALRQIEPEFLSRMFEVSNV
jgi:adenine-specific DNA-methyltransferase